MQATQRSLISRYREAMPSSPVRQANAKLSSSASTNFFADILASATTDFERELIDAVTCRIRMLTADVREAGVDERALGDVEEIADRMIASIPRAHPLNLELGPFYTSMSLSKWMGVTKQYLHELVRQRRILALTTADNHKVYPSFQFGLSGSPLSGLAAVLGVLDRELEPWTEAMWLVTRNAALKNATPVDWLKDGGDLAVVVLSANQSLQVFAGNAGPTR
jgi:hypothetical protein